MSTVTKIILKKDFKAWLFGPELMASADVPSDMVCQMSPPIMIAAVEKLQREDRLNNELKQALEDYSGNMAAFAVEFPTYQSLESAALIYAAAEEEWG